MAEFNDCMELGDACVGIPAPSKILSFILGARMRHIKGINIGCGVQDLKGCRETASD